MLHNDPLQAYHQLIETECYRTAVDVVGEMYANNIEPALILRALAARDHHGNSMLVCMLSNEIYLHDELLAVEILRSVLQRGVEPAEILLLLAMRNKLGGNFFHALMSPSQRPALHNGLRFLCELLHAAGEQKREFANVIYQLLTQEEAYAVNPNLRDKPVDALSLYSPECLREYVSFVVKLARNGMSREFIENLLDKKSHSLLPEFWIEVARQSDQQLLKFISSGFLKGAEYQTFSDSKTKLFGCVLKMDDEDKKRAYLENILDAKHPLGKLFLLKTKSDYRYINKRNGFLRVASDALQQMLPSKKASDFVMLDSVSKPARVGVPTMIV